MLDGAATFDSKWEIRELPANSWFSDYHMHSGVASRRALMSRMLCDNIT